MSCINQSNGTPCRTNRNSGSNTRTTNCVAEVVAFINELQNAVIDPCCLTNCLNPVVGERQEALQANTRPFILFGNDGKPFTAYYRQKSRRCRRSEANYCDECYGQEEQRLCPSFVFRVECVEGNCAILRVLKMENERHRSELEENCHNDCSPNFCLELTDSCITVDLNCFSGIECLEDVRLS